MSADRGLITLELEWKTNNLVRLEYHAFPLIGTLSTRQEEETYFHLLLAIYLMGHLL